MSRRELECALVLLENGVDPDLYNMGKTPLMSAATCADLGAIASWSAPTT